MSSASFDVSERAQRLRDAFDQDFAAAPRPAPPAMHDLLAVRVGPDIYALPVNELSGVVSKRKIVPLPSDRHELLGIAGIRGSLVPVYSLPVLLGYPPSHADAPWLALCGGAAALALAFDELLGFLRVADADRFTPAVAETSRRHIGQVVRVETATYGVVDVRALLAVLKQDAGATGSTKEP